MSSIGSISSVSATLINGFQRAQDQQVQALQALSGGDATAPLDSAEFSDAARAAGTDSIAAGAVELTQATAATKALVLVARAEKQESQALIDMLA